ncbi:hypothetical protein SAY87_021950 [Trapa incisa]|uniref:ENTH domain-containing protein n=1 Tax=Trapa incisa TaxID=236973 RepID=A0AAN7PRK7_9MYRT|nr:hypothetical protein SAY87_021950 [Trapa incisa]
MGQRRKLRTLLRLFGDKVSIIRASVSLNRAASHVHLAVLRATSVSTSCSAPSDRRLSAVLRLGHGSSITTSACVAALMTRLHSTNDAIVALKTLITVHALISRSSSSNILDHQLSFLATGAWNPLNLSSFRDDSDAETWELSSCVRWYAEYLEQILIANKALGYLPISPSPASAQQPYLRGGEACVRRLRRCERRYLPQSGRARRSAGGADELRAEGGAGPAGQSRRVQGEATEAFRE